MLCTCTLSSVIWSSWLKSWKPGRFLAKFTTILMAGVKNCENSCHCSALSLPGSPDSSFVRGFSGHACNVASRMYVIVIVNNHCNCAGKPNFRALDENL